ncbi:MAG: hypothetical protein A3G75_15760 [Verrucomicrobia bacterium RIFCSPLOWO2_12_FULL_64_8]|nr:MAG: hypothetical protein A3G75_15760 [Verrucomicrobia bacterium RIFCSPLOWO2_12_FULL_64_8]
MSRGVLALALGCAMVVRTAGGAEIPEAELARPPTAERVAALLQEASVTGWVDIARQLEGVAPRLYEKNGPAALAWFYLHRWARLFTTTENEIVPLWIDAVNRAKAGHANMRRSYPASDKTLAQDWPRDLQAYVLGSIGFSDQFFSLIQPLDYPPGVFAVLRGLWTADPKRFKECPALALAIAVVYDVPPPPGWPHGQVGPEALSRQLPDPAVVMAFFANADMAGAALHRLRRLPAFELKFVVDLCAPPAELTWAQQTIQTPLASFAKVYDLIRYRRDRAEIGQFMWPLPKYELPLILQQGGICVDQAYFASTVGKARGVPTLLFRGAGLDGRHAWFGFLDANGRWQLDAGRYAEQKYVAGVTFDPQTWTDINDHELKFMTEGFRKLPTYKTSRLHQFFAEEYARLGDLRAAAGAARSAVNAEPRNQAAWEVLIGLRQRLAAEPKEIEGLYQDAARAFARYPDVESGFKDRLIKSLRARGQTSLADAAERETVRKYTQTERSDLGVQQAQEILQRSLQHDDLPGRVKTFYGVLNSFGRGAGVEFFDKIVQPFVDHLLAGGETREALQAVNRARQTLRVEPGRQLEAEFNALLEKVQKAQR